MRHFNFLSNFRWFTTVILLITLGIGQMWGETAFSETFAKCTGTLGWSGTAAQGTFTTDNSGWTTANAYGAGGSAKFGTGSKKGTAQTPNISCGTATAATLTFKAGAWNASSEKTTLVLTYTNCSGDKSSVTMKKGEFTNYTVALSAITGNIRIQFAGQNSKDSRFLLDDVVVTYTAASCSANPSIGTASLNGSFNMTSTTSTIGIASGTCSTGNAACDWTDYGFVWSDGANTTTPTVGGTNCNKVKVGESGTGTSWTGSITPSGSTTPTSWTTGHTYYVRTYGKNSKAGAAFVEGSAWSFTPYMVTFNKNDGGATTSTQYVQGGVSTTLTTNSFSRTGYTFAGWNTNADGTSGANYSNGQSVNLDANLDLYAKWTAKTYNITLDREGATTGATSVTMTYNSSSFTGWSAPSKEGHTFGGYWTGDNGTGTMVIDANGTLQANVTNYTGAGGIWTKDATCTLYAKWTPISYSVTWKVSGAAYTTGGPSDHADYGTTWSSLTLPTDPDPASYCGQVFVGWTTDNIGSTGLDKDDDAARISALNLMTSANKSSKSNTITGETTFHAVFADYTTE